METQFQISKGSSSNTNSNENSIPDLQRKLQQYSIKWKLNSRSQKEAPAILNQMQTQFQISKGSSSNTQSNANSIPDLKRKLQQYSIKWKLNSRSQKEAPAILNQMETQFQISKGSSSNTKSNADSIPDLKRKLQQY